MQPLVNHSPAELREEGPESYIFWQVLLSFHYMLIINNNKQDIKDEQVFVGCVFETSKWEMRGLFSVTEEQLSNSSWYLVSAGQYKAQHYNGENGIFSPNWIWLQHKVIYQEKDETIMKATISKGDISSGVKSQHKHFIPRSMSTSCLTVAVFQCPTSSRDYAEILEKAGWSVSVKLRFCDWYPLARLIWTQ